MKPGEQRLWIDRMGVRMDEPRERYHITDQQVMVSVEYVGPMQDELLEFRAAMEDYFTYCRDCRMAQSQAVALPEMPPALIKYLQRKEATSAKSRKTQAKAAQEQPDS